MNAVNISLTQARRFLIRRQKFVAYGGPFSGPDGVVQALQRLEAVQIDPICAFERNHHQVLFNRVQGYRPEWLDQALYERHEAFEYYANGLCVLPMQHFPYFRASMRQEYSAVTEKVDQEMLQVTREVLQHVRECGETSARDFDSGRKVYGWWESSGNNPCTRTEKLISDRGVMVLHASNRPPGTKIEKQALDYLHLVGELLISSRKGNLRHFDLPERIVPQDILACEVSELESRRRLMLKFLRGYGLAHLSQPGFRFGWHKGPKSEKKRLLLQLVEEGKVVPVTIGGVKRTYFCVAELLADLTDISPLRENESAVILAPLDNLLWDRDRLEDLWGFRYRWEVYTPAAKRQYGYYVVPLLHGEWIVGRIELQADKQGSRLCVRNLWLEPGFEGVRPAIQNALELEARYLGLETVHGL